jgi:hypothetical protein
MQAAVKTSVARCAGRCSRWLLALLGASLTATALRAEIVSGMPDAIVCSVRDPTGTLPWARLIFYVSARTSDGRTLYKTLTSDPVVLLVSADGVIAGNNLADCDGRRVQTLMEEGRAFVLTQPATAR